MRRLLFIIASSAIFGVSGLAAAQSLDSIGEGMTRQERIDEAGELVDEAEEAVEATTELAEDVQEEEGDVTQLRCVNDALVSMNGFLQVADEAYDALVDAQLPELEQNHHFRLVVISHQRVMGLRGEARQCAGEIVRYTGGAQSDSSYAGVIPSENPAEPEPLTADTGEPPVGSRIPDASPDQ